MEHYKNVIRRQVKGGHEIYLRDVQDFQIEPLPYGGKIIITMETGGIYEKNFDFYKR